VRLAGGSARSALWDHSVLPSTSTTYDATPPGKKSASCLASRAAEDAAATAADAMQNATIAAMPRAFSSARRFIGRLAGGALFGLALPRLPGVVAQFDRRRLRLAFRRLLEPRKLALQELHLGRVGRDLFGCVLHQLRVGAFEAVFAGRDR